MALDLDDIRKLAAEERVLVEALPRPPWFPGDWAPGDLVVHAEGINLCEVNEVGLFPPPDPPALARHFARSRTVVPALCDAVDALLAVIDALPMCVCGALATWDDLRGGHYCDACAGPTPKSSRSLLELPYAAAIRALLPKGPAR